MDITFLGTPCTIDANRKYGNNRTAIILVERGTGEDFLTASTNIPDKHIDLDEVIIKDFSENQGIFKALVNIGAITDTGKKVSSGYVTCPVGKLNLVGK
jgi:hypothetical protein